MMVAKLTGDKKLIKVRKKIIKRESRYCVGATLVKGFYFNTHVLRFNYHFKIKHSSFL